MKKAELRDKLFNKYFETNEGILATDLLENLSFISETTKQLSFLCTKNIKDFHPFSKIYKIGVYVINNNKYLILQTGFWRYTILNINTGLNISKEEFRNNFDENFFIENFNDEKIDFDKPFYELYGIAEYNGDINELVLFYYENENVFSLTNELWYKFNIGDAVTYFYIDFANAQAQMCFETKDQFLYEQLFLKYDLSPSNLQDAQSKIGVDKMLEMFEKIKDIKIPIEVIPNDLLEEYKKNIPKKKVLKINGEDNEKF